MSTFEYLYDANGNMTSDANKQIEAIQYNHLNQPLRIDLGGNNIIEYLYTATGTKLRQSAYKEGNLTEQMDYVGNYIYQNEQLAYILTGDGRLVPNNNGYTYEYFLTDHLGSTRVTFAKSTTGEAAIVQEDHYYPYGMVLGGQSFNDTSTPNPFLYNGKEQDKNTGYYQYGFRQYDAGIGRWHVADALAEKYFDSSPYAYVLGNPVSSVDLMGLSVMSQGDRFRQEYSNYWGSEYPTGPSYEDLNSEIAVGGGTYWVNNSDYGSATPEKLAEMGFSGYFTTARGKLYTIAINGFGVFNFGGIDVSNAGMPYSSEFVKKFMQYEFGDIPKKYSFEIMLGLPENTKNETFTLNKDGSFKYGSSDALGNWTFNNVGGYVKAFYYNDGTLATQKMYLAPYAFKNALRLYIISGHELVHVGQNAAGLNDITSAKENGAWQFSLKAADTYGDDQFVKMSKDMLAHDYWVDKSIDISAYHYSNFIPAMGFKQINVFGNMIIY